MRPGGRNVLNLLTAKDQKRSDGLSAQGRGCEVAPGGLPRGRRLGSCSAGEQAASAVAVSETLRVLWFARLPFSHLPQEIQAAPKKSTHKVYCSSRSKSNRMRKT